MPRSLAQTATRAGKRLRTSVNLSVSKGLAWGITHDATRIVWVLRTLQDLKAASLAIPASGFAASGMTKWER